MSWLAYALLSALFAALVAILGKLGVQQVDVMTATTLRAFVMAGFLGILATGSGSWRQVEAVSPKAWLFIAAAGLAGALSWLCYFKALHLGPVVQVASVDRLSGVITLALAMLFLHERPSLPVLAGVGFIVLGGVLVARG